MKKIILTFGVIALTALIGLIDPALAQMGISETNPPAPNAASQAPQSANSLPGVSSSNLPQSNRSAPVFTQQSVMGQGPYSETIISPVAGNRE